MLADVDAGSDTPSLVGKVLKWRKEKSIEGKSDFKSLCSSYNSPLLLADALWKHLDQLNQSLAQTLLHLSKLHDQDPENYKNAVKYISSLQSVQASPSYLLIWKMVNPFAFKSGMRIPSSLQKNYPS
jgi:phosphomevalonate kinase